MTEPRVVDGLNRMLAPETIAIVGLSDDPTKHGHRVAQNLRRLGYDGEVVGVNPRLPHVDGLTVVGSVAEMTGPPDLVVCAVPAPAVHEVVSECAGVGGVVVFAGGFGETGTEGRAMEARIKETATRLGVRILGPNSGGIIRPSRQVAASFLTCLDRPPAEIRSGPVGLVTQSGGTGSYVSNLAFEIGSGVAVSISTGNETDITISEGLAAAALLDEVEAVVLIVETVRDGLRFADAIRGCVAGGTPVVACLIGTGSHGERLMQSHTGASAVPARMLAGVLESVGAHVAETPGEAYDIAETVARLGSAGPRVGVVTHSGGLAILLSDLAEKHRLVLPEPSPQLVSDLAPLLDHGAASNPLDMGGIIGGPARFGEVVATFAGSGEFDVVMAVSSAHPPAHTEQRVDALLAMETDVPVLHLWMAGDLGAEGLARLRAAGAAATIEPRVAMRALAALVGSELVGKERPEPITEGPEHWGVPFVRSERAADVDQGVAAARAIGFPVVVKVDAPTVTHKTEFGGVMTGIETEEDVIGAVGQIITRARDAGVESAGVRIEPYRPGLELVLSAFVDPQIGPVASVGFGGVYTEVVGDISYGAAPVTEEEALRMIDGLVMRRVLDGVRGQPAADVVGLARLVSLVSRGLAGSDYREVEINPLIWDGEWVAVDWLAI